MISEAQARTLLKECEERIGCRLDSFHKRFASSDDMLGTLWELLVLHSALDLGDTNHEPTTGCPDVWVEPEPGKGFWIEATHINLPDREDLETTSKFIHWVRKELSKKGLDPTCYHVQLERIVPHEEHFSLPAENEWARLRRDTQWTQFFQEAGTRKGSRHDVSLPTGCNLRVVLTHYGSPQKGLTSGHPGRPPIRRHEEHPVYKAIRDKGSQAKTWSLDRPVVLCIGSSLSISLLRTSDVVTAKMATLAALHRGAGVRGADRIAAVVLVSIEEATSTWPWLDSHRVAVGDFVLNHEARFPLEQAQLESLRLLHLNKVRYGPQWETWPALGRKEKKDMDRPLRRSEPGKEHVVSLLGGDAFAIEVPSEDVGQLLAGSGRSSDLVDCLNGFERIQKKLERKPRLTAVELVPGDPKQRIAPRIKFVFGPPDEPLLQVPRPSDPDPR